MTTNVKNLSGQKLKSLMSPKLGSVTVLYAESLTSCQRVLLDSYPRAVGTTFSTLFAKAFPPVTKIALAEFGKPRANSVLIIGGGPPDTHRQILQWMLACCEAGGAGLVPYPRATRQEFTTSYLVKTAAQTLGVTHVVEEIDRRMAAIFAKQVHSEDVRALYKLLGREHALVKQVVERTADLIVTRKIRAYKVYVSLMEELKEFGEDIQPIIKSKAEELAARGASQNAVGQKRKTHTVNGNTGEKPQTQSGAETGNGTYTISQRIECPVRNGYCKIPLVELGVGLDGNFVKDTGPADRRGRQQSDMGRWRHR